MILIVGTNDSTWQDRVRFLARSTWPNQALRVVHPDQIAGPSELLTEDITGVILDNTRPDLVAVCGERGLRVEVVPVALPAEPEPKTAAKPEGVEAPKRKTRGSDS